VLVTNDDGVDSALLVPLLDALDVALPPGVAVRAVVPAEERSWFGKSMTRFAHVVVGSAVRGTHAVTTLSGTPADCAAWGVEHAFAAVGEGVMPDLVVSGTNLGMNAGAAFMISSGTVGAALEGAIAGVKSIAVSLSLGKEARVALKETGRVPCDLAASEYAAAIAARALEPGAWPEGVDVLNVNLPQNVGRGAAWEVTRVARSRYTKVFSPVEGAAEGTFQHAPESLEWLDDSDGTDYAALRRGAVSVTPLRLEGMFLSTEGNPLALRAATEPLVRAAFGEQLDSTTRVP